MDHEEDVRLRQLSEMEFLIKTGDDSVRSIHRKLLPFYGEDTVDRISIQRWLQRFEEGDLSLLDNPHCSRSSTTVSDVNKETNDQIIQNDRCVMTHVLPINREQPPVNRCGRVIAGLEDELHH